MKNLFHKDAVVFSYAMVITNFIVITFMIDKLNKKVKKSWLRFGFPQSYTSDILETLYYLAKLDLSVRREYSDALQIVISRMQEDKRWINDNNFKSPMLVTIEPKNAPSKWITFRACFVLKKYANLEFTC